MDIRMTDQQIEPLLCRVEYARPPAWQDPESTKGLWPHDNEGRALAYSVKERDEIIVELNVAKVTYRLIAEDQPDPAFLSQLQGKVKTRTEALAAIANHALPACLDDIADLKLRIVALESKVTSVEL